MIHFYRFILIIAVFLYALFPNQSMAMGDITGVITDQHGVPVEGHKVHLIRGQCKIPPAGISNPYAGYSYTYQDGIYLIPELYASDNDLFLLVIPGDGSEYWYDGSGVGTTDCTSAIPIHVDNGTTLSGVSFSTIRPNLGAISGLVTNIEGTPLTGVQMDLYSARCDFSNTSFLGTTSTGSDGVFLRNFLSTSNVIYIRSNNFLGTENDEWWDGADGSPDCNDAIPVQLEAGIISDGIDFVLEETNATVSGTLTYQGLPYDQGVQIQMYTEKCNRGEHKITIHNSPDTGSFTTTRLGPGTYYATAVPLDSYTMPLVFWDGNNGNTDCTAMTPIIVEEGVNTDNIDFVLQPGGQISGTVSDQDNSPLASTYVYSYTGICGEGFLQRALTDSNGFYQLDRQPVGENSSYIIATMNNHVPQWWEAADLYCNYGNAVPVTANSVTENIDFHLKRSGTISGVIKNNGEAYENVAVHAYDAPCNGNNLGIAAFSDSNGLFTISYLPTGTVYILASTATEESQWWGNPTNCEQASPVTVLFGENSGNINFDFGSANQNKNFWLLVMPAILRPGNDQ